MHKIYLVNVRIGERILEHFQQPINVDFYIFFLIKWRDDETTYQVVEEKKKREKRT